MTAPASTIDLVVGNLLSYWAGVANAWRSNHGSNTAIRKAQKACMPTDPKFLEVYPHLALADPAYPPQLGKNMIFQRIRFGPWDNDGRHRHTLFMMPMEPGTLPDGRWDVKFGIAGVKPCHESCTLNPQVTSQRLLEHLLRLQAGTFLGRPIAIPTGRKWRIP